MEKLLKNKKIIIAIVLLSLITLFIIYAFWKNSMKFNPQVLQGLIDKEYSATILEEEKDAINLNIVGNLNNKEVENLTKKIYNTGEKWNKNNINFIVSKTEVKDTNEFYNSDLISKVSIDYKKKRADLSTFLEIHKTEKAKKLQSFTKGSITSKEDKTFVVSLDMDLMDKTPEEVVSQAQSFISLFKDTNKNKDLGIIELHLNENATSNVYNFNSSFENILETIKVLTF